jgi:hypothetical protein
MCWFIDLDVVPQKASIAKHIRIPELPGPDKLHGKGLSFSYYDSHCACELVAKNRIGALALAVDGFCDQEAVKRLEVRKYWASSKSPHPPEISTTQSEFREICAGQGPEADFLYRISPDRFHQR